MSIPISLQKLAVHLIDQIEEGRDSALAVAGDRGVRLRVVEAIIPFTAADDTGTSLTVVVGEVPVTLDEARRQIASLRGLVHVDAGALAHTPRHVIGSLTLRLLF
jgi:hypothetical protein